jgi:hypothetical protein
MRRILLVLFAVIVSFGFAEKMSAAGYLYQVLSTGQSLAAIASGVMNLSIQEKFFATIGNRPIVSNHALGSTPYSGLKKGTDRYNLGMTQLNTVHTQAQSEGKIHQVIGVTAIHGESDELNNVKANTYKGYLTEWQHDYETDIKAVTGQVGTVPLYTCQMSSFTWAGKATPQVTIGQLAAAEENPDKIILVGPKYFFNYISLQPFHLDETNNSRFGSRLLSEYYAKVINLVFNQHQQWKPLMPIDIVRNGREIYAKFHIPQNATKLEFDTTLVDAMRNKGFEYFSIDSSGAISAINISSVAIINNDTVKIILDEIPTGENQVLAYAVTGEAGAKPGAHVVGSAKGNLRDNDATVAMFDSSVRLYNWAVHFWKPVRTYTGPPVISQATPVLTPSTDTTPSYTFNTTEVGTITYGGSCSSTAKIATVGKNTITFNSLAVGTYSNCTIRVMDAVGNASNILSVNSFTINALSINGTCGAAQGSYLATDTYWRDPVCANGLPSPLLPWPFLAPGATMNWQCVGENGGTTASCSATRASNAIIPNAPSGLGVL